FDHEIMRLLQQLGLADGALDYARPAPAYEFRAADGKPLLRFDLPAQSPSAWSTGYMFNQPGMENALRGLLADLPEAEVRLERRFVALSQDADGVTAELEGPNGAEQVRARYLVGCDGASSPVRQAIGGALSDYQFDEPWLVVDARILPGARTPDINLQICDPKRPTTCVLMGPGRHRWEFMLLPGEEPERMLDEALVQSLIAPWDCGPVELERKAVYRFHGLVADRWRDGRVLLAGDSAHQTPPFAGQGMCSGLRDAANLAWKLGAVLDGAADEALLDTYQTEREPHVRALIEFAIGMGRVVCALDPQVAAERDRSMLAQRAAGAPALRPTAPAPLTVGVVIPGAPLAGTLCPQLLIDGQRSDDVFGDGPWLISRAAIETDHPPLKAISAKASRFAPFAEGLLDLLGLAPGAALLVRPDRYVFGAGAPETLVTAYVRAVARPAAPPSLATDSGVIGEVQGQMAEH
ncbi:MAG: bifunctional 3-(3-hydroxy-phenyl)propionate/3-hydroxycinnamic acid hydroxylase, partial [Caulobacteraceae bacterium]|nr:bifunctional 3-(3-hydroxy-phenyl)propionate/3-hydroxycinnamic acid hydroxylase [Caulobacteraceae bacterium]